MDRIDLMVFGATGFTGKHVVEFLVRTGKEKEYEDLRWGIAGRSPKKLFALKKEIEKMGKDTSDLVIMECNVDDELSIKAMTQKCKVLVNCVGPFTVLGESVIKACIETGTHCVDISAEANNMLNVFKKYNEAARKAKVLIIPACGFCSIPAVAGIIYLRDNFEGEIDTVEMYAELNIPEYAYIPGPKSTIIHYGTWTSFIHVLKNMRIYLDLRHELIEENKTKEPPGLKKSFLHRHEGKLWFPYPGPDDVLVQMSENQLAKSHQKKPIIFKAYGTMPRFYHFFIIIPIVLIFYYLCYFNCFRRMLRRNPRLFSFGYVSHTGPTPETRKNTTYSFTFVGKQWEHDKVTKSLKAQISGKDPGYENTAAAFVISAITVLKECTKMPKYGVLMPGAAFYNTSIISRLKDHGFKFQIVEH